MAVMGIDEVGRGPWAGPLVVGAVILPEEKPEWVADLKDSKKLTAKRRKELSELILAEAPAMGLGWVSAYEIDEIGLAAALRLATWRAVGAIKRDKKGGLAKFDQIIIDGTANFLAGTPLEGRVSVVVKGDNLIKEISAASIVAKVARDEYMCRVAEKYPEYGFESHKGYGVKRHREAIAAHGACPETRVSYKPVQRLLGMELTPEEKAEEKRKRKDTTGVGKHAEQVVAGYLETQGHQVLMRNYKTQICEIDIVSVRGEEIYFTEVKYRRDGLRGGGFAAVTSAKKRKMEFGAKVFLHNEPQYRSLQPLLAVAEVGGPDFRISEWMVID